MAEYSSKKDSNIYLEDFLKFYQNSSRIKPDVVFKNLKNLRWRRDLRKYDDEIDNFNEPAMMRYYLYKENRFYDMLFDLIGQQKESKD